MISNLVEWRAHASETSGGISSSSVRNQVHFLVKEHNLHGSVLDFGSGKGDLLRELTFDENRWTRIVGVDLFSRPLNCPKAIEWFQGDLNEPLGAEIGLFDLVICSEVIEHLENPRHVFRTIRNVLKNGGALILTQPNQESIRSFLALIFRGHFVSFSDSCYPAHITALVRKDLAHICTETGFLKPVFSYTNNGGIPKFPSVTWQDISLGMLGGRLFSDNVAIFTRLPLIESAPADSDG